MVQTMSEQDMILNLKAAGFDRTLLQTFLDCWKAENYIEQLELLSQKRAELLAQIHRKEKQINCLDYLVYQIAHAETGERRV